MRQFTTNQFNSMNSVQKTALIESCIDELHNNSAIQIDTNEINNLHDFIAWLVNNIKKMP